MVADVSHLHGNHHEDYEVAKQHIFAQLGTLSGLALFGRQVLVAVYVRPAVNPRTGLTSIEKKQQEDWYESKVVLVIDHGPEAFMGDESYMQATFPGGVPPKIGDWLFQNAGTGIQMSMCGDDAERVKYKDRHGDEQSMYPSDGWPVRIVTDASFLGILLKPHQVV